MKKFTFNLVETYSKNVTVEADSYEEAFEKLDYMVQCGDENAVDLGDAIIGGYDYEIYPVK